MEIAKDKTPSTANRIMTEAGRLISLAAEVRTRARERAEKKMPTCPVAEAEADFAQLTAAHLHRTDSQACTDRAEINALVEDMASIKRMAKWTLGILISAVGTGGIIQLGQWVRYFFQHLCLIFALGLALSGCGRPDIKLPADAVAGREISTEPATLADARLSLVDAAARLAMAKEKVRALEKAQEQARVESHRRTLAWATGLAILGALACVFLAIFLPVMRKRMVLAAIGCAATILAAQAVGVALPWLPLVGAGLAVVVLAGGLWVAIRALWDSTGLADRLKALAGLGPDDPELTSTRAEQVRRGTRGLILATRKAGKPRA
jgi:hypothetical protein